MTSEEKDLAPRKIIQDSQKIHTHGGYHSQATAGSLEIKWKLEISNMVRHSEKFVSIHVSETVIIRRLKRFEVGIRFILPDERLYLPEVVYSSGLPARPLVVS